MEIIQNIKHWLDLQLNILNQELRSIVNSFGFLSSKNINSNNDFDKNVDLQQDKKEDITDLINDSLNNSSFQNQNVNDDNSKLNNDKSENILSDIKIGDDNKLFIKNENILSALQSKKSQELQQGPLFVVDKIAPYFIIVLLNLTIGISVFYGITLDRNNTFFSMFDIDNLGIKISNAEHLIDEKDRQIENLKGKINEYISRVPRKIYLKNQNYINLSKDLKNELSTYYDDTSGILKTTKAGDIKKLQKLFRDNEELEVLSVSFNKEHVLNSINENKIYWKEVYNKLQEATNNAFKYNNILNYITYDNFSVDEKGKISVSGIVRDPSGKVFAQLINLTKAINSHDNFYGASINTYQKKVSSDKSIGGMESSINLSFFYTTNKK